MTRESKDQGIDITAWKEGKKYGIQCKYYSSPVGNHAVQEAFAGAKYYNCDIAVVMTNSTFTKSAKELAHKTDVLLWEKNKMPSSFGFQPTRYIGIFALAAGGAGLWRLYQTGQTVPFALQTIELSLLMAGGLLGVLERGHWKVSCLSGILYLSCGLLESADALLFQNPRPFGFLFFFVLAFLSFLRTRFLRKISSQD